MAYVPLSKSKPSTSYTPLSKQPDKVKALSAANDALAHPTPPPAPNPAAGLPVPGAPNMQDIKYTPLSATSRGSTPAFAEYQPPIQIAQPRKPGEPFGGTGSVLRAPTAAETAATPPMTEQQAIDAHFSAMEQMDREKFGTPVYTPVGKITMDNGPLTGITKTTLELPARLFQDVKDTVNTVRGKGADLHPNVPSYLTDANGVYQAAKDEGFTDSQASALAVLQGVGSGLFDLSVGAGLFGSSAKVLAKATAQDLDTIAAWKTLGSPADMDAATKNYRALSHEFHPDMQGGSQQIQSKLNSAYELIQKNGVPSEPKMILNRVATKLGDPFGRAQSLIEKADTTQPPQRALPGPGDAGAPEPKVNIKAPAEVPPVESGPTMPEPPAATETKITPPDVPPPVKGEKLSDEQFIAKYIEAHAHPSLAGFELYTETNLVGEAYLSRNAPELLGLDPQKVVETYKKLYPEQGSNAPAAPEPKAPAPATQPGYDIATLAPDSKKVATAFTQSVGQKVVGENGGVKFELGSFGTNHDLRKTGEGKFDRFPAAELSDTIDNIKTAYRANTDPTNYRSGNVAWIAKMPDGTERAIYTRTNANGAEEIISWHNIKNVDNYVSTLEKNGTPDRTRTGTLSLEKKRPIPLADEGTSSVNPPKEKVNSPKTPAKASDYHIFNAQSYKYELVKNAKPIDIVPGVDTFIHRGKEGGWVVSEGKTGSFVGSGPTRTAAKADALKHFERAKELGVNPEQVVEKAVERTMAGPGKLAPRYEGTTQKEIVKKSVEEGPKSIKQVAEETKILEPNVRRILGQGAKDGTFERTDKGVYVLKKDGKDIAYIHTGDAVDTLPKLAADGFKADMVFLDIPYNTPAVRGGNRGIKYDYITPEQFKTVVDAVAKIARTDSSPIFYMFSQAKSGLIAMRKYTNTLLEAGLKPVARGEYTKLQMDGVTQVRNMRGDVMEPEGIILLSKSGSVDFKASDLNYKLIRPKGYNTEKPAELLRSLIRMSTAEGEVVLDPFAGSGVTGSEAVKAKRTPVLIEKSAQVVEEVIKPRLSKAMEEAGALFEGGKAPELESKAGAPLGFNPKSIDDLEPKAMAKEQEKIIKRSDIAKELSKKLNVPIRRGKYRVPGAIGIYKPTEDIIRIKSGGLYTVFHEVGHFIDDNVEGLHTALLSGPKAIKDAMKERAALMTDYGHDYSGEPKKQAKEAFAEFVRLYYTDQAEALKRAPNFFKYYEANLERMPEIRDAMQTASDDFKRWREMPSTAKVLSQLSIGAEDASLPIGEKLANTYHDLYDMAIDDLHPLDEFVKLAKEKGVIPAEENPYILARNLRGWTGKATTFLEKGTFGRKFWKQEGNEIVPNLTGKSFKEIVRPIEKAGNLDNFRVYLTSTRAIELAKRDIVTGIARKDAEAAFVELHDKHPEFAKASAELMKYQDDVLKYAQESGLITPDAGTDEYASAMDQAKGPQGIAAMREANKFYVPFFRVMEELQTRGYMGKGIGNLSKQIKTIRGSERDIVDPLESIVKNTYSLINASERNAVALAMVRMSKMSPELGRMMEHVPVDMVPTKVNVGEVIDSALGPIGKMMLTPDAQVGLDAISDMMVNIFKPSFFQKGGNIISVMVAGKPQYFQVEKELYNAIQGLDQEQVAMVIKFLSMPAKWLRAGATLTPEFMVRNPARDQMTAFVYSKYGFIPYVDWARGMFSVLKQDKAFWLWRMGGGEHSMLASLDREYLQSNFKEVLKGKGAVHYLKNPLEVLQIVSEIGEQGTRLGEMKRALGKLKSPVEGAFASREVTLDFSRIGAKTKAINMLVAFWNANVQGFDKMVRAFKEAPVATTAKTLAGITTPSVLLYYANRKDPRYKEIPQWQKDLFWIVMTKDHIYRIPKPFELGILFGSVPERILEYIDNGDPEIFAELEASISNGASPGFIPTALLPIIENTSNYSFFLDQPIVPDSVKNLPPEAQYTESTSETAKKLGNILGYSPAKIDNLLQGYFGGLGVYGFQATDAILKGTGIANPITPPAVKFEQLPLIKGFTIKEPIGSSSESYQRFYAKYDEATAGEAYLKKLVAAGKKDEAKAYVADHPEVALAPLYTLVANQFTQIRKAEDSIRQDKKMTAQEKRNKLDQLDRLITDISEKALTMKQKQP